MDGVKYNTIEIIGRQHHEILYKKEKVKNLNLVDIMAAGKDSKGFKRIQKDKMKKKRFELLIEGIIEGTFVCKEHHNFNCTECNIKEDLTLLTIKYVDNPSLSWEERYNLLMTHHIEEISQLYSKIKALKAGMKHTSNCMEK